MSNTGNIRLIVTDMDETLLTKDKNVSPFTMSVINEIREKGVYFSICTGRIQTMTLTYERELGLKTPYITSNGAMIWDPVSGKPLRSRPLDEADVLAMAEFCEENEIDYGVLAMDTSYFYRGGLTVSRFYDYNEMAVSMDLPPVKTDVVDRELKCLRGVKADKFLIFDPELKKLDRAEEFLKDIPGIGYTKSMPYLIDIMYKGICKGTGVAGLAEILGLKKEEICSFGDYLNDISMFENSGCSVAMGNAAPEVKKAADYITLTNNEDGVAYAIRNILKL